ncbi:hypothetical protein QFZ23_004771 [Arthrobacter globiformis]|nr:hypothetical protein [Arthrobacter globiformis]
MPYIDINPHRRRPGLGILTIMTAVVVVLALTSR